MPLWRPDVAVDRGTLSLSRRSTAAFTYKLDGLRVFPAGSGAFMRFYNSYGQEIAAWEGEVTGGSAHFEVEPDLADAIPAGSSFELIVDDGVPHLRLWGNVIRDEAKYPNEPVATDANNALQYSYNFLTPGKVVDPAWRILNGSPTIYDNSGSGKPNAVACGILWDDGAMMWYAPMAGDSIKINYTLKTAGNGKCTLGMCSNYDGTNWLGVTHRDNGGSDQLLVEVGTGPVNMSTQQTTSHALTDLSNYTAHYNFQTNTLAVYKGTDLTPITTWVDSSNLVRHGAGERYFMFNWRAAILSPGPELVSFKIIDAE